MWKNSTRASLSFSLTVYRYSDEVITHKQDMMYQRILQIETEGEVRRKWEGSRPSRSLLFHTDGEREGEEGGISFR